MAWDKFVQQVVSFDRIRCAPCSCALHPDVRHYSVLEVYALVQTQHGNCINTACPRLRMLGDYAGCCSDP